jgi:hypothetical protein
MIIRNDAAANPMRKWKGRIRRKRMKGMFAVVVAEEAGIAASLRHGAVKKIRDDDGAVDGERKEQQHEEERKGKGNKDDERLSTRGMQTMECVS